MADKRDMIVVAVLAGIVALALLGKQSSTSTSGGGGGGGGPGDMVRNPGFASFVYDVGIVRIFE